MWLDQRGSEVLTRNECLRLLAVGAGGIGRFGLVDAAGQVVIEPVNYRMLDQDVLIQVGPGSMLDAATDQRIVSFEIDELSIAENRAWSVLVRGLASLVEEERPAKMARPRGSGPLVPEPGTSFVRIRTGVLSGRRFTIRANQASTRSAAATASEP